MNPDLHNPPAFPRPASVDTSSGTLPDGDTVISEQCGMSLREWFAGQALIGILAWQRDFSPVEVGKLAYLHADAMLAARQKK